MEPTLRNDQLVIFHRSNRFRIGDILLLRSEGRELVKRLQALDKGSYILEGDNIAKSKSYLVGVDQIYGRLLWPRLKH